MQDLLAIAVDAAHQAGQRLMHLYGHAETRHKDSSRNLVTQADLESEALICDTIASKFPEHAFLGEEAHAEGQAKDEHLWIIDPLDATNNYAHGIPHFCVSIAYAHLGEVMLGVVHDPVRGETFTAMKGLGARLNGLPIQVRRAESLSDSIIATGFYYDRGVMMERTLSSIGALFRANIRGIRRMGSAALDLAWVASGRFDAYFEYRLEPWDYAAGQLLVTEAGGLCGDRAGALLQLESRSILASAPGVWSEVLERVRWDGGEYQG